MTWCPTQVGPVIGFGKRGYDSGIRVIEQTAENRPRLTHIGIHPWPWEEPEYLMNNGKLRLLKMSQGIGGYTYTAIITLK